MPGMTWDSTADSQLLLSILSVHDIKVDYVAVADLMGPSCTACACQKRLLKLKKVAAEANGSAPKKAAADKATYQTTKAPKPTAAKANNTKNAKAPATKKLRANRAKLLRTDSPEPASDNDADGNVSDDEANPSTDGKANGHNNGRNAATSKLAKSVLAVKRKAEDELDSKVAIKKEKLESDAEDDDGAEEEIGEDGVDHEEENYPNQQLLNDSQYGEMVAI